VIEAGSSLTYLVNQSDPGVGLDWVDPSFDDGSWLPGTYGIGYGAGLLAETIVPSGASSIYTRAVFQVADVTQVANLFAAVDYDDGTIVYINGVEILRSPEMPAGAPGWNTAAAPHESSNGPAPIYRPQIDLSSIAIPALVNGDNVLAVGVWNNGPASSDLVVVPQVTLNRETKIEREPYLQIATTDGVTVRWRSSIPQISRVEYGTVQGNLTESVESAQAVHDHEVTLSGLDPATTYYYAVGSPDGMLAGDDADHFFVTAPVTGTPGPTRFWVLGDSGTGNSNSAAVRDAYYAPTTPTPGRRTPTCG